jgi:hypothetical protein
MILLCLTFRNCMTLAISSNLCYNHRFPNHLMLFLCFFRSDQVGITADIELIVCEDVNEQLQIEATNNFPELNIIGRSKAARYWNKGLGCRRFTIQYNKDMTAVHSASPFYCNARWFSRAIFLQCVYEL